MRLHWINVRVPLYILGYGIPYTYVKKIHFSPKQGGVVGHDRPNHFSPKGNVGEVQYWDNVWTFGPFRRLQSFGWVEFRGFWVLRRVLGGVGG